MFVFIITNRDGILCNVRDSGRYLVYLLILNIAFTLACYLSYCRFTLCSIHIDNLQFYVWFEAL